MVKHREGGDPSTSRKSPGRTEYEAITLERGVTHDLEFEQWANKVWNFGAGLGAEVSLKDFRKDIIIEVYNEAGQLVIAYNVYRCWVSEYQALPDLDANANAVAIQHIKLENEGWERDIEVPEPTEPSFIAALTMARTRAITLPHGVLAGGRVERDGGATRADGRRRGMCVLERRRRHPRRARQPLCSSDAWCSLGGRQLQPAPGAVRSLVTGDREALLLHLRALDVRRSPRLRARLPACGEAMDLELSIEELLVRARTPIRASEHEAVLDDGWRRPLPASHRRRSRGGRSRAASVEERRAVRCSSDASSDARRRNPRPRRKSRDARAARWLISTRRPRSGS